MINRGPNFQQFPLTICGSSKFGRYPKINAEYTYNMLLSDNFMVPYSGYIAAILSSIFGDGTIGRAIFTSTNYNRLVVVISANVYLVTIVYNHTLEEVTGYTVSFIGKLNTIAGVVYIAENNGNQIGFSDSQYFYIYDSTSSPAFQVIDTGFTPGYLTFHNSYFLMPDRTPSSSSPGTNQWRLSNPDDGTVWPFTENRVGSLETKADLTQAVVRFPSKGNMILVMGKVVTEAWFYTAAQLFPYQRNNQFNIDYGCLQPATVAYMDEIVVWLAGNEKSGPIIMYSDGGMPHKITTDGIDYVFSNLNNPSDSEAFIFRQDGHLIYHINFYTDNLSLFYDFNLDKFYHACDENLNYYIASDVAFYQNQYYFITPNNGNVYAFDSQFYTYDGNEIPRIRTCANIRIPEQDYLIINDVGFTIESGTTDYQQQSLGPIILITQDDNKILTQDSNDILIAQQPGNTGIGYLSLPHVDISISIDGGATFGNEWAYYLPAIGHRKNRLMWWNLGVANDLVCQFKFWGMGRFVATDGLVNCRK